MAESGGCSPIALRRSIDEQPELITATVDSSAQRSRTTRFDIGLPFTQALLTRSLFRLGRRLRCVIDDAGGHGADGDAARRGNHALHDAFGIDVEHADRIAERAGFLRLA